MSEDVPKYGFYTTLHVDDFIDSRDTDAYASFVLNLFRLNASLKLKFREQIAKYKLFCTFKGKRYRVTGASRLGDVWLSKNFEIDVGYTYRVNVSECSAWSAEQKPQIQT